MHSCSRGSLLVHMTPYVHLANKLAEKGHRAPRRFKKRYQKGLRRG
ncbi:unnamed protein product [Brassica napus]|uniref:(rape) hypothetical protein n=1 Tax=Brassica napus TaxID=3708 RepID=A0A816JQN0_BRANA|nr:unnamed protein product [Brassica napus]